MANELPFFSVWVKDFLGDNRVDAMTAEELGAYWRLLLMSWQEDPAASLPPDEGLLARWARLDTARWSACRERILACFTLGRDGRWYQKRLRQEYESALLKRETRASAGRAGAEARWQTHGKRMFLPMAKGCDSGSDYNSGSLGNGLGGAGEGQGAGEPAGDPFVAFAASVRGSSPGCADWFPEWARRHAMRFAWRRPEDPEFIAGWWPALAALRVTEVEAEAASLWLLEADKQPRGRPEHLGRLKGRVRQLRKAGAAPISGEGEAAPAPTEEQMERLRRLKDSIGKGGCA